MLFYLSTESNDEEMEEHNDESRPLLTASPCAICELMKWRKPRELIIKLRDDSIPGVKIIKYTSRCLVCNNKNVISLQLG